MDALTALIHEDATQSMPPFDLWLAGRDDILTWWFGPGNGCRGSRVIPVESANGAPAFGQYKPRDERGGLRAVGAAGARDRERPHRRAHLLPRRRHAVPALRASARVPRVAPRPLGEDVRQAHQLDELEERLRCVRGAPRSHVVSAASCRRASASTVTASGSTPATSQSTTTACSRRARHRRGRRGRGGPRGGSGRGWRRRPRAARLSASLD